MKERGFTLIELLMVAAIISLLATVILGSLSTARFKAMDATIQRQAVSMRTLMEFERGETNSYTALKSAGWKPNTSACSAGLSGSYASQAQGLCEGLLSTMGSTCTANCIYFGNTSPNTSTKYSIMVYLPGASLEAGSAQYLCLGSNGHTSETPFGTWNTVGGGCYADTTL
jgi:prepilin-type N-terminal cleavage/methylation domain-containing protein